MSVTALRVRLYRLLLLWALESIVVDHDGYAHKCGLKGKIMFDRQQIKYTRAPQCPGIREQRNSLGLTSVVYLLATSDHGQEYKKYKQAFQPFRGQVSNDECNSTRWDAGSRGINSGYFALLTSCSTTHVVSEPLEFLAKRGAQSAKAEARTPAERRSAMTWAQRLKRVFRIDIETCTAFGGAMRIIACIEEQVVIKAILAHLADKARPLHAPRLPPGQAALASSLSVSLNVNRSSVFFTDAVGSMPGQGIG